MRESEPDPIRVFLVETSALTLTLLKRALASTSTVQVVGDTLDPRQALAILAECAPHVVCVGLHLPEVDGYTLVHAIMERFPCPILVIGTELRDGDQATVFRLFAAGALDLFLEPLAWRTADGDPFSRELTKKIRTLARMDQLQYHPPHTPLPGQTSTALPQSALPAVNMVVIGAGLGGVNALREILATLPVHFPSAILCIVHLHPLLSPFLPRWLADVTAMPVQEATHGEVPMPGSIYLPPPGQHLLVDALGRLATSRVAARDQSEWYRHQVPSIAMAMESAATHFAPVVIGVLLSGTGEDGARGLEAIASCGGYTLAMDDASAMAFDLPARLLEMGAVRHLLPCNAMGQALLTLTGSHDPANHCGSTVPPDQWPPAQPANHTTNTANPTVTDSPTTAPDTAVLVVEDSPTQAFKLRRFLQTAGLTTAVAKDGLEGVAMTKALRPHLVLSDVSMPRMDGFELCRTIKRDPLLKAIPVILLTALTHPAEILEGLAAGADNYLTKPWEETFLLARIHEMLAMRDQRQTEQALTITFADRNYTITSSRRQVLDLLMTTYQKAVEQNKELLDNHLELKMLNSRLVGQTARLELANQNLQQEIAEREKIEKTQARTLQELAVANQELNDFAYIIAHDLKAPFRAIGSLTSWLLSDYAESLETEGRDLVHLLHGRAERLDSLIGALLQYTRVSRLNEELQEVDLNRLVSQIIRDLNPPDTMEVVLDTPLPTIRFDPKRATQLFHSLIDNAIRFMDKPLGVVRIALEAEEPAWWHFAVKDNGPGIEETYFEKIFGIFQTLQPRDQMETAGMGLALARKIVSKFGGRIWVTSTCGTGSNFYFTLPKNPEEY